MNICLLGDFSPRPDEGYKNVCHALAGQLAAGRNQIECLSVKRIHSPAFWNGLWKSHAQIYHLITQPTLSSLGFCCLVRRLKPEAKVVLSALKPETLYQSEMANGLLSSLLKSASPHLAIVQTRAAQQWFEHQGIHSTCIPHGVDTQRFSPVNSQAKNRLRKKYSIETQIPVAIHVGHLNEARNLEAMLDLPKQKIEAVIVGSTYMGVDFNLVGRLREAGVRVIVGYQPDIEEYYQLADIYVFPVLPGNSLSLPLSVLEAMACNLPVIATRFPGLLEHFQEGKGLFYLNHTQELPLLLMKVLETDCISDTREMVKGISWESLATKMQTCYSQLLSSPCLR